MKAELNEKIAQIIKENPKFDLILLIIVLLLVGCGSDQEESGFFARPTVLPPATAAGQVETPIPTPAPTSTIGPPPPEDFSRMSREELIRRLVSEVKQYLGEVIQNDFPEVLPSASQDSVALARGGRYVLTIVNGNTTIGLTYGNDGLTLQEGQVVPNAFINTVYLKTDNDGTVYLVVRLGGSFPDKIQRFNSQGLSTVDPLRIYIGYIDREGVFHVGSDYNFRVQ